jgi:hypothetical protein
VVKAAENILCSDPASGWQLMPIGYRAWQRPAVEIRDPRPQACMWSPLIVVGYPLSQDVPEVPLAERDHVIEALTPDRSHQPFTVGIGLRRPHWSTQNPQTERLQVVVDLGRKDRVRIMDEEAIPVIAGDSFSKLLQGQAAVGWAVTFQCGMRRLPTSITTKAYSTRKPAVITTKKSAATIALA